ncbi:oligosaccharide flippase family protein [Palleronia caenipelagi]|uniref:Polysaccharide biosynthesis protein n=1 Tax=Palleronia caenipelagi TaxID=2489174 RepID=A0A547PMG2_9RHOB|nr:oligosaccharide flippase family protein [Palleronia caenipelagi]TRD15331.1 polysaccharide biosynthesis protein [Palleronia caenipelagi]
MLTWCTSELLAKLSRILVVIGVARFLDVGEIGLAASALAVSDIIKSLTQNGIFQRIIAAPEHALESHCLTARRLFGWWSLALFALQTGVAFGCYVLGADPLLAAFIGILGLEYLIMVPGLVSAALAMRDGKINTMAVVAGTQIISSNLLTVLVCLIHPTGLALILPRLLTAPVWTLAVRRIRPWHPNQAAKPAPMAPFLKYGLPVLGISLTEALRLHADRLVVGIFLGVEQLGVYFMAFNAGLSLSNAFSIAFAKVFFPYFCAHEDRNLAFRHTTALSVVAVTPVVVLQAFLAPYYVPFLLGDDWSQISPIVSTLCLVAIPTVIWTASANWLRVNHLPQRELVVTICLAIGTILSTILLAPYGLQVMAVGYLGVVAAIMFAASIPVVWTTGKGTVAHV